KAGCVWTFREAWQHHLALEVPRRLGLSPGAIANPGEDVVRDAERTAKLSSARPVNTLPLTKSLGGHRLLLCVVAGSGSVGEGRYRLCEGRGEERRRSHPLWEGSATSSSVGGRLYEPRIDVDAVAAIDVRTHIEA